MFIGLIGTRYAGKTTVIDYLKTRGFTVLKLRSGDGTNDEDTSTAASSEADHRQQNLLGDVDGSGLTATYGTTAAGSSAQPIAGSSGVDPMLGTLAQR